MILKPPQIPFYTTVAIIYTIIYTLLSNYLNMCVHFNVVLLS